MRILSLYQDFKFLFHSSPSYMIFWVTQNCNFTCEHCFNYLENQKQDSDLSLEEINKLTDSLGHIKYLTLAGGEPFLRKDLSEIVDLFYRKNDLHILNIVTNGWFKGQVIEFCHKTKEKCLNLTIAINISLDGTEDIHDKIRMMPGSYQRCFETINAIDELNLPGVSTAAGGVYTKKNEDDLFILAETLFRNEIPFFVNYIRGEDVQNNDYLHPDPKGFQKLSRLIEDNNEKLFSKDYPYRRTRLAVDKEVHDIIFKSVAENKMTLPCRAIEKGFVLTADGDVLACEVLNERTGNIREHHYNIKNILKSKKALAFRKRIKESNCHCTWECFQAMNVVFDWKGYPKILINSL